MPYLAKGGREKHYWLGSFDTILVFHTAESLAYTN